MSKQYYKEIIQSNFAGLNPTGTLDYNGTFKMNGNNNVVLNASQTAHKNLAQVQNNKVVCLNIENFENMNYINEKEKNKMIFMLIILIILITSFLFYIK